MSRPRVDAVELLEVDAGNWRDVAALRVHPGQGEFVAAPAYYLCLAHYGDVWQPLAVAVDGRVVGMLMWALDTDDGSHWLGGVLVDAAEQGRGIGRAAIQALLRRFESEPGYRQAALSISADNVVARRLYASLGFVETAERVDDEIVARRDRPA